MLNADIEKAAPVPAASPICNQLLLAPLNKQTFFKEIENKNVEETRALLIFLAKKSIGQDHTVTKAIHDVLIDIELAYPQKEVCCVISLENLEEKNKSAFTLVFENSAIIFYKVDQLQLMFDRKPEWSHNRREPTKSEISYLSAQFKVNVVLPQPVANLPHLTRVDGDSHGSTCSNILVLGFVAAISIYLGWVLLLLPIIILVDTVVRSLRQHESEEQRARIRNDQIVGAVYLTCFATIFGVLMGTGVARDLAEKFQGHSLMGNVTADAGGFASAIAVLTPIALAYIAGLCRRYIYQMQARAHAAATREPHLLLERSAHYPTINEPPRLTGPSM